jgi:hypothetical protein
VIGTGASGPTASPDGPTAPGIGAGGPIATPGGPTARPYAAPPSPTSLTSGASRAAPLTSAAPHAASTALVSQLYPLHYSRRPQAAQEPPTLPLYQQPPPTKAVPVAPPVNPHLMTTRAKRGFRISIDKLSLLATSSLTLSLVPTSVRVTHTDPFWRRAMEVEYDVLIANNTWELVPRPVGSNVVTGKWIFKHKFNSDGTLERYKARWVLRSFTERPDIDYDETSSPVVKPATIRTVLSLAVSRSWPIHQLDIKNAFLYSTLSETVYCSQPTGFIDPT